MGQKEVTASQRFAALLLTNRRGYVGSDALFLREVWIFVGKLNAEARMLLDEPHQVLSLRLASHIYTQSTAQCLHYRQGGQIRTG